MDLWLVAEPEEGAMLVIDERSAEVVGVQHGLPREVRARDEQLDAPVRGRRAPLGLDVPACRLDVEPPRQLRLDLRQEVLVALQERFRPAPEPRAEHPGERAELDPRVAHVVDRAAADDRAREQAPVEPAGARAGDDVGPEDAARQPEEPAVHGDGLVLVLDRLEPGPPSSVDLRDDAADPDGEAPTAVEDERQAGSPVAPSSCRLPRGQLSPTRRDRVKHGPSIG